MLETPASIKRFAKSVAFTSVFPAICCNHTIDGINTDNDMTANVFTPLQQTQALYCLCADNHKDTPASNSAQSFLVNEYHHQFELEVLVVRAIASTTGL